MYCVEQHIQNCIRDLSAELERTVEGYRSFRLYGKIEAYQDVLCFIKDRERLSYTEEGKAIVDSVIAKLKEDNNNG